MTGQRFGVTHVDHALEQAERVETLRTGFEAALHSERQKGNAVVTQVALCHGIQRAVGKSGIVDPRDSRVIAEKFGYLSGVFDVALYAERHGLDTLKKQKAIERRHRGASVSLGYSAATGDECGSAVMFDVNDAVISGLRTGEHVIAVGIIAPGEFSAVNDHSANRSSVAAHELGHGRDDDIGAVLDGAKQDWRCHGVVDDQRHAVLVGNSCEPLDVRDVSGRIPYAFAEYGSG